MERPRVDDARMLFGALILGFVAFLLINYLSLFGVMTVRIWSSSPSAW